VLITHPPVALDAIGLGSMGVALAGVTPTALKVSASRVRMTIKALNNFRFMCSPFDAVGKKTDYEIAIIL
jgi:hypothetical protein